MVKKLMRPFGRIAFSKPPSHSRERFKLIGEFRIQCVVWLLAEGVGIRSRAGLASPALPLEGHAPSCLREAPVTP